MKALILANGNKPDNALLQEHLKDADIVFAVDGAASYVKEYRIKADALIGDMDSVQPDDLKYIEEQKIKIIRLQREKDDTDTMRALDEAIKQGADEIVLLGAVGHRFDHSYANALLLVRALRHHAAARIADNKNILFAASGKVELHGQKGDFVSVLPLMEGTAADASYGLKYPLIKLSLPLENPIGVSNEMTDTKAGFEIISGIALIVLSKD